MKAKNSFKILNITLCLLLAISIIQISVFVAPSSAVSQDEELQLQATTEGKDEQQSPAMVVEQLVYELDSQNYDALINLWISQEQDELRQFFSSPDAKAKGEGFHSIKDAKLLSLKQLPIEAGTDYGAEATDYISEYGDACLYYVALDLKVRNESKYFINGANYLLVLLVPESDQWKIALMPKAPVGVLNQDGFGFDDEAEKKAIKRQKHLEKTGEVINENGTVIEDLAASPEQNLEEKGGKDTLHIFKEDAELSKSDASIAATDDHTVPSTIRVYLTNSGTNKSFEFYYYVKNVLPNEWYSNWPDKSLQAGALAVKMYGWYRVYVPKYPGKGYDVRDDDSDQTFKVNSEVTSCTAAINAVGGIGVDRKDGNLFATLVCN
ncbi:SpoIID/LytB domain-containing protein [Desulfoscipio gibsoniae]|uniref:Stage II sporulation protein n=1 Tax=Desulfoscipio gibsoniae DSM 7213 TaxID=767817 RepID=R4KKY3_9FIRM|nr:SpoIID/LytB domain-containing protein [Desulfoscipio gibsoniae]AGL03319.1 Stage II sporulation protein [Desulfoscipio gibsoniae DSM 7213]